MNKKIIILIGLVIIANILLRIPLKFVETGDDSFQNHFLIQSIIDSGYSGINENSLSIIGYSPDSYPQGVFLIIASISLLSNISVPITILLYSFLVAILSFYMCFQLGLLLFKSDYLLALMMGMFYSISSIFIKFSTWSLTTRTFFMMLIPAYIFFFLKSNSNYHDMKYNLITVLIIMLLFTLHRMSIILFILSILTIISQKVLTRIKNKKNFLKYYSIATYSIITCLLVIQFLPIPFFTNNKYEYLDSSFFRVHSGSGFFNNAIIFINMLINYFSRFSIVIIFFVIGFVITIKKMKENKFDPKHTILFFMTLFLIPLLTKGLYVSLVGYIFFCYFAVYFLKIMKSKISGNYFSIFISLVFIFILLFSQVNVYRQLLHPQIDQQNEFFEESNYPLANYLDENLDSKALVSNKLLNRRLFTISDKIALPKPGHNFIYYHIKNSSLSHEIQDLNPKLDSSYNIWEFIIGHSLNNKLNQQLLNSFETNYVLDIKTDSYIRRQKWELYKSMELKSSKIFDDGSKEVLKIT